MSRYSNERLYNFLCQISRHAKTRDDLAQAQSNNASNAAFKLKSINQLKEIVDYVKKVGKGNPKGEEEQISKTYDLFLNDLLYLKDLKKYFDDEIYNVLMKYHYDVNVGTNANTTSTKTGQNNNVFMTSVDRNRGNKESDNNNKQFLISKSAKSNKQPSKDELQYAETVKELKTILDKWDGLLKHDVLDLNHFDPDSYHELMQFKGYTQFEAVLRLVPDLFAKCYKCIDLAKTWLQLSNLVLGDLPEVIIDDNEAKDEEVFLTEPSDVSGSTESSEAVAKAEEEFWKEVKKIQGQINDVTQSIAEDEKTLQR